MNSSLGAYSLPPREEDASSPAPPSFLFGAATKRRSMALAATNPYLNSFSNAGGPSADIFASPSPVPAHVKGDGQGSGSKSVHWSPALVQEEGRQLSRMASPSVKGPPLRSLNNQPLDSPIIERKPNSLTTDLASTQETTTDHWVTVFGFPSNYSDKVLKLMSKHGEIVAHKFPRRGNWVSLRYSCPLHARQAISRHSALLDGCIRIGVVPATEHDIADASNRTVLNLSIAESSMVEERRVNELPPPMEDSGDRSFASQSTGERSISRASSMRSASRAGMRSLAVGSPRLQGPMEEPQKQEGIMGRLWSLVGN